MTSSGPDIGGPVREEARRQRRIRQQAARIRVRRARFALLASIAAVAALAGVWRTLGPFDSGAASGSSDLSTGVSALAASSASAEPPADPLTPRFAHYRTVQIFLPVTEESLTEVAFHQASGTNALPLTSYAPDADMAAAERNAGTGRTPPRPEAGAAVPNILGGEVLRMWRTTATGAPDTAADIGAAPGSPVFAPVSGTVTAVNPYVLYGNHDDLEIHIQPTGWPELDLVVIHVTDPTVKAGDAVVGGVTRIASVRLLSDRIDHQLGGYTKDGGDHVHLQLNRVQKGEQPTATGGS